MHEKDSSEEGDKEVKPIITFIRSKRTKRRGE